MKKKTLEAEVRCGQGARHAAVAPAAPWNVSIARFTDTVTTATPGAASMQTLLKLIGKESRDLPYRVTRTIPLDDPAQVWTVHDAVSTRDENAPPVTLFRFERRRHHGSRADVCEHLARAGVQRLRTVRHPDILRFVDSSELSAGAAQSESLQLVTEAVVPLQFVLRSDPISLTAETIVWGLFCIARALHFIHTEMKSVHGRLSPATVFVTAGGDWKLGGLEVLTESAQWQRLSEARQFQFANYWPPELHTPVPPATAIPTHALDAWAFGCLMYELFSGGQYQTVDDLRRIQVIPEKLRSVYSLFLAADSAKRAALQSFLTQEHILQMPFVRLNLALDRLQLSEHWEKRSTMESLLESLDKLPPSFCVYKAAPLLQQAIDLGVADPAAIRVVLRIHRRFENRQGPETRAFMEAVARWLRASPIDVRNEVAQALDWLVERADTSQLNEILFPAMVANLPRQITIQTGTASTTSQSTSDPRAGSPSAMEQVVPLALRDMVLKTIARIAPRLSERNRNHVLMNHFAKLQLDPEPAIRTNTTICLGKIATLLSATTQKKVLVAAFTRAMRDSFPPARAAGIAALEATADLYARDDMVSRILPALCQGLGDKVADVREQAFRVTDAYLRRLRTMHEQEKEREDRERVAEIQPGTSTASALGARAAASKSDRAGSWHFASLAASLVDVFDATKQEHAAGTSLNRASQANHAEADRRSAVAGAALKPSALNAEDNALLSITRETQASTPTPMSARDRGTRPEAPPNAARLSAEQFAAPIASPSADTHRPAALSSTAVHASMSSLSRSTRAPSASLWEAALAEECMRTAEAARCRDAPAAMRTRSNAGAPAAAAGGAAVQQPQGPATEPLASVPDANDWALVLNSADARRRRAVKLGAMRRSTS